jgi:hypothetical protein
MIKIKKRTGAKKLADEKQGRTVTQYCIDGILVHEVLNQINSDIKIIGAQVMVGKGFSKHKVAISNRLKRLGVSSLRAHLPAQEASVVFDETTKEAIQKNIEGVAKEIGADPDKAYFKYITLDNGTCKGKFERTSKEIKPYDEDLRRKLIVLGLTDADGKVSSLIADLGAKKYECKIHFEEVRTIICSKIG